MYDEKKKKKQPQQLKGIDMKNKILLSVLCTTIAMTTACSKKALSELAANEDQNSRGGGSGGSGGGTGGSGGSSSGTTKIYLMNTDTTYNTSLGKILKFDTSAKTYTDLNIVNSTSQWYAAAFTNNSSANLGFNAFHPTDPGTFLIRNDSGTYNVYYFDYTTENVTSTNVPAVGQYQYIAYSGGFGITKNAQQNSYYVINGPGGTSVDANTFLGLDGSTESVTNTTYSLHYGLSRGIFISNSVPNGQTTSDKLLIYNAASPSTITRVSTDQIVLTVMSYSDTSAIVATGNVAGDRAVYFINLSTLSATKILDYPVSGDSVVLSLASHQDTNLDYYVIVRNSTLSKHSLIKVNHTTGAISTVAEEDATNLTNSMFDCTLTTANYNKSSSTFGSTVFNNSKLYFTCKTSNKVYLIETDFTNQTMTTYVLNAANSQYSYLFKYKDELYATTSSSEFAQITLSGGNLTLSSTTSNTLMTDIIASCNANITGADCNSLTIAGNMGSITTGINKIVMVQPPNIFQFMVPINSVSTYAMAGISDQAVTMSGTIRTDSTPHQKEDMYNLVHWYYSTCINVPMIF